MSSAVATPLSVRIARSAVLAAAAVVLALTVRFPLLPAAPFLLYEPSDIPLLLGAFLLGPTWAAGIAATVAVVLAAVGGGGVVGGVSRFSGSAALGCTAAFVYRAWRDQRRAAWLAISIGTAAYVVVEVLLTLILGPLFFGSFEAAAEAIVPLVIPFNILKGGLNGAVALSSLALLNRMGWIPPTRNERR